MNQPDVPASATLLVATIDGALRLYRLANFKKPQGLAHAAAPVPAETPAWAVEALAGEAGSPAFEEESSETSVSSPAPGLQGPAAAAAAAATARAERAVAAAAAAAAQQEAARAQQQQEQQQQQQSPPPPPKAPAQQQAAAVALPSDDDDLESDGGEEDAGSSASSASWGTDSGGEEVDQPPGVWLLSQTWVLCCIWQAIDVCEPSNINVQFLPHVLITASAMFHVAAIKIALPTVASPGKRRQHGVLLKQKKAAHPATKAPGAITAAPTGTSGAPAGSVFAPPAPSAAPAAASQPLFNFAQAPAAAATAPGSLFGSAAASALGATSTATAFGGLNLFSSAPQSQPAFGLTFPAASALALAPPSVVPAGGLERSGSIPGPSGAGKGKAAAGGAFALPTDAFQRVEAIKAAPGGRILIIPRSSSPWCNDDIETCG